MQWIAQLKDTIRTFDCQTGESDEILRKALAYGKNPNYFEKKLSQISRVEKNSELSKSKKLWWMRWYKNQIRNVLEQIRAS